MIARATDLLLVASASVFLVLVVALVPSPGAVRVALGLPFVLFFPGYALLAALFPRRQELDPLERLALSFGLSLAIVPLIGLLLNYTPWGIRLWPILVSLTIFVGSCLAVAAFRRHTLAEGEVFVVPIPLMLARPREFGLLSAFLSLLLAASLVALGAAIYVAATSKGRGEKFTEFYVLGPGGKAEGYPRGLLVGGEATVILGVVNREGQGATYRIESRIADDRLGTLGPLYLKDGERSETSVTIRPTKAGERQRLDFALFKDEGPEPYRSLHLYLDVTARGVPTQGTAAPPATIVAGTITPSPTSASGLTPAPTAAPR